MNPWKKAADWIREDSTRTAVALLTFYILYTYGFWSFSSLFTENAQNRISLTNFLMSSLLTLILIAVYLEMAESQREQAEGASKQAALQEDVVDLQRRQLSQQERVLEIQENQTEIIDRQTELMEAQSAARIQFEGIKKVEGDDVYIQLSNIGESAAEDLKLVTEFEFESDRYDAELGHWPLHRDEKENENRPNFLESGERHAMFTAHVPVQLMDTKTGSASLREFWTTMSQLHEDGVEECEVTLYLLGGDLVDEASAQQIWHETVKVKEEMDFEDAYRQHYI